MRYVLIGNYGVGNLGDELLKEYFLKAFPEVEWRVVSAHPQSGEFTRLPLGLRSFFSFGWLKTLRAIQQADGVVFGGGTLFTDVESVRACVLWWWHARMCRRLGKPIYLAWQGIGPFKTNWGEKLAQSVCAEATFISVRDELSLERVRTWNLNTKVVQSFDPVISLVHKRNRSGSIKNVFAIIPRHNSGDQLAFRALELAEHGSFDEVHLLSMQPNHRNEKRICRRLESMLMHHVKTVPVRTLDELTTELRRASFILSERFHGSLIGLALGREVEVVSQHEDDKHAMLRHAMAHMERCRELVEAEAEALRSALTGE